MGDVRITGYSLKKLQEEIENALFPRLRVAAKTMLEHAAQKKSYKGFTGNTQTSYSAGIYIRGVLREVAVQKTYGKPPVFRKIRKGERKRLRNPYEGKARTVRGTVDVNDLSGVSTSLEFLAGYKFPKGQSGIVVTTGTEYSLYIEVARRLNVLTATWNAAPGIAKRALS